jgi:Flp pilus assembly protein TadG
MLRQSSRGKRGSTIVEFALSFSLIFTIFSGLFVFGYGFYTYNRLQAAVRLGGRYASLRTYDGSSQTQANAFSNAVKNMVVYNSTSTGTSPVVPNLVPDNVSVNVTYADGKPDRVQVYISSYTIDGVFWRVPLRDKPSSTFRYEGRIAGL